MSISAMKFKTIFDGSASVNQEQQTVVSGQNNVLQVTGLASGDVLKFEVSVDGGATFVEDDSLKFEANGTITLEKVSAIIKAKVDSVASTASLKILLGY